MAAPFVPLLYDLFYTSRLDFLHQAKRFVDYIYYFKKYIYIITNFIVFVNIQIKQALVRLLGNEITNPGTVVIELYQELLKIYIAKAAHTTLKLTNI